MPLLDMVEASSNLGSRQKVQQKAQVKIQVEVEIQQEIEVEQEKEQMVEIEVEVAQITQKIKVDTDVERRLRREPYAPRQVIPPHVHMFRRQAYKPIQLGVALGLRGDELIADATNTSPRWGSVLAAQEIFSMKKSLMKGLAVFPQMIGGDGRTPESHILFSLNMAPVWQNNGSAPVYTPYVDQEEQNMYMREREGERREEEVNLAYSYD